MNLIKSKTFKIPGGELEKIIVTKDKVIYYTKTAGKGFSFKLTMSSIDSAMNESSITDIAKSEDFDHQNVSFNIDYNKKKNIFLVWYLVEAGNATKLFYHLCDSRGIIRNGIRNMEMKTGEIFISETCLDDSGNFYFINSLTSRYKSKNAEDFKHYFSALKLSENRLITELINNQKTFISSYKLTYNEISGMVNVFGLYGEQDEEENTGFFNINFDTRKFEIYNSVFNTFDRKLVAGIIGVKNEQKGENLSKFKIKKAIARTDSGVLIIAERIFITTQSDIFYVNGIPQSSYARIYNNDEVILLSLDIQGNVVWQDFIQKNQASVNDGGYYNSIVVMVNEDKINIMYNDRLNANADIIQVTYMANGSHNKKILLNNDQYFALVIPNEYNQVTTNSLVIPVNQNREFTYIKLVY